MIFLHEAFRSHGLYRFLRQTLAKISFDVEGEKLKEFSDENHRGFLGIRFLFLGLCCESWESDRCLVGRWTLENSPKIQSEFFGRTSVESIKGYTVYT